MTMTQALIIAIKMINNDKNSDNLFYRLRTLFLAIEGS